MENVYSKEKLLSVYSEDNLPANPNKIINKMLHQEIDQLKKITDNLPDNQEKNQIISYYFHQHLPIYILDYREEVDFVIYQT
jgi:glutamyl-tRNA reductase